MKYLLRLPTSKAARWIALGALVVALVSWWLHRRTNVETDRTVITLAHWHLQSGVPEVIDGIIREYERLHPRVRIEQIVVPERIWPVWQRTRLIGGNPPDILELGSVRGMTDELLAHYMRPLTPYVSEPNPYNQGTTLSSTPWRETFIDGLSGSDAFSSVLMEYYGVPSALFTVRVYANANLLKGIQGTPKPPTSWEEFVQLCEQTKVYAAARKLPLVPIAGSRFNAPHLVDRLRLAALQKRAEAQDVFRNLEPDLALRSGASAMGFLRGMWSFKDEDVRLSLDLTRKVAGYMQPGFAQVGREEATFLFTQGKALMIVTGNFDITSLQSEASFPLIVFDIPLPEPGSSRYGKFIVGPSSEASKMPAGVFGVTKSSRNPEIAIDFLRFFTSRAINQRFSAETLWLPAVIDVPVPKEAAAFSPRISGALDGPDLFQSESLRLLYLTRSHLLYGPTGGVDEFIDAVEPMYPAAIRSDIATRARISASEIRRTDSLLGALRAPSPIADPTAQRRASRLLESQVLQELSHAQSTETLRATSASAAGK